MPAELIEWVSKLGAAAAPIFLYLWFDERAERRALQAKFDDFFERNVTATVEMKNLLQTVVDIFNGRKI